MKIRACILAAAVAAAVLLAACGDEGQPELSPSPSPGGTSPAATASPGAGGTPAATPGFGGTRGPVDKQAPLVPPSGAIMNDVRTGAHDTYDRVVFVFENGLPGYRIEYVQPPILADASGEPVQILGNAFLSVRFNVAAAHDPDTGDPTYLGPSQIDAALTSLVEMERTGDFEGYLTWVLGLSEEVDFNVLELNGPYRVVVDVAHP